MKEILHMSEKTVEKVAYLEERCFETPWSAHSLFEELENPWAIWLTAWEDHELMGYLGVHYGPDGADVMSVASNPRWRRRGAAKELFAAMEQELHQRNLKWLTLEVRPSNVAAIRLYQSLNFQQVGRRPKYYQNPREDALLMTKYFEEDSNADSGN